MPLPTNRRGFLRGFAIASATTATGALVLPAVAEPAAPHPDADLLAAFAEAERLEAEYGAAREVASAASRAARADEGPIPEALMLNAEESCLCRSWDKVGRLHFGGRFHWRPSDKPAAEGIYHQPDPAWSGFALRKAIEHAVSDLGPAGRTPHLLRRWRGLLPVADAYDRQVENAHLRHRTRDLHDLERRAQQVLHEAQARVRAVSATTPEGLAVHVRAFDGFSRENIPHHVLPLLLSAASVAGVAIKLHGDEVQA